MATLRSSRRRILPPKDPAAAAMRPRNALEKAAMNSFRQKIAASNQVSICNSTSDKVGKNPMRSILQFDKFCVPIFQRKYCWTETQWQTLLEDAVTKPQHSLGRLTCTNNSSESTGQAVHQAGIPGRSCILDGQQRFTTVTILLATIRDLLEEGLHGSPNGYDPSEKEKVTKVIMSINDILFLSPIELRVWLAKPLTTLSEGIELPFARLVPTFCDRWSYYSAILPLKNNAKKGQIVSEQVDLSWHRPLLAKQFFQKELRTRFPSTDQLLSLLRSVLDGLTMVYFPVDTGKGHEDGTEDLMVIYERLAIRDATFCKPSRTEEYHSMDGADMVRNLLLGSFPKLDDAVGFYKDTWLPLEKLTSSATFGHSLPDVLETFLDKQEQERTDNEGEQVGEVPVGIIGGKLYSRFQQWFQETMGSSAQEMEDKALVQRHVVQVGSKLLAFANGMKTAL